MLLPVLPIVAVIDLMEAADLHSNLTFQIRGDERGVTITKQMCEVSQYLINISKPSLH